MNTARFELRYRSLSAHRCGYAFPCDEQGQVDLDQLSDEARENYLSWSAATCIPKVSPVH